VRRRRGEGRSRGAAAFFGGWQCKRAKRVGAGRSRGWRIG
jgi:hypothetical protein